MEKIVKETFKPDDEEVKKDDKVIEENLLRGAVGSTSPKRSQLEKNDQ
jgi:hypothetical protein